MALALARPSRAAAWKLTVFLAVVGLTACNDEVITPVPSSTDARPVGRGLASDNADHWRFVAPGGVSSGSGDIGHPWNLAWALNGASVAAGDTIWLREGIYSQSQFYSNLSGTATNHIVVKQYPGEHAVIDKNAGYPDTLSTLLVNGTNTEWWDFEVTNSEGTRSTTLGGSQWRGHAVYNKGSNNRFVDLVLHDAGTGFYTEPSVTGLEIIGCIIYNNGWNSSASPARGHGHGLYLQSNGGTILAKDNIIFNQFGYGIHVYADSSGTQVYLRNITAQGNVSFDNGSVSDYGTSANFGNLGFPAAENLAVTDNTFYMDPSLTGGRVTAHGSATSSTWDNNVEVGGSGVTEGAWATIMNSNWREFWPSWKPPKIIVRSHMAGRAYIMVLNGSTSGSPVTVTLPSGILNQYDYYDLRNVQKLDSVGGGSYNGSSITVPMTGVVAPPLARSGNPVSGAPRTGPSGFDVFLLTKSLPFTAVLSGPTLIDSTGNYAWIGNGPGSTYSYAWYYKPDGGVETLVGTSWKYVRTVSVPADPSFTIRLLVTKNSNGQQAQISQHVFVGI
jgi:hypothetical protein